MSLYKHIVKPQHLKELIVSANLSTTKMAEKLNVQICLHGKCSDKGKALKLGNDNKDRLFHILNMVNRALLQKLL